MQLKFSTNYIDDLMILTLDKDFNVIDNELKDPVMCEIAFKDGIPNDNESLKEFFHNNMGRNDQIKDYIDHIEKYGFYNPYERNLRITIVNN